MIHAMHESGHFRSAGRRPLVWFARPKVAAMGCLALLAGLGWIYLGLMVAGMGSAVPPSPGGNPPVLNLVADRMGLGGWGRATLEALCRPTFGVAQAGSGVVDITAAALM